MAEKSHLILIPGVLCDETIWLSQIDDLSDIADSRVTYEQMRYDDISVMASAILSQAPQNFSLAGFSLGGYIALEIIRQASHRVDRIAIIHSSASRCTKAEQARRERLLDYLKTNDFNDVMKSFLYLYIHSAAQ